MSDTDTHITLAELARTVQMSTETVATMVRCGIVEPGGEEPKHWLFEPQMIPLIQRAGRLQRDLDLEWPAVALALDLMEDLRRLREENRRLRRQLDALMELEAGA